MFSKFLGEIMDLMPRSRSYWIGTNFYISRQCLLQFVNYNAKSDTTFDVMERIKTNLENFVFSEKTIKE